MACVSDLNTLAPRAGISPDVGSAHRRRVAQAGSGGPGRHLPL